ncbi:hypothetical protein GPECTOR_45g120 [Gonium pectorale]|uniref:Uncharacterized protein n=1 Tax=Gonium pectorale TaxID=33097 RepID=A0A150GA75_GONPE|nr:hypothetical protein GPECTOR_45g120 [Gonium pectorale]|eukprot:KXZ46250.1 hypothetical protein GPECTOR_45g120 [Gonium pectorale]
MSHPFQRSSSHVSLEDVLCELSLSGKDVLARSLQKLRSLRAARLACTALRDAVDFSTVSLELRLKKQNPDKFARFGPLPLHRWPRCRSLTVHEGKKPDWTTDGLLAFALERVAPEHLLRITSLTLIGVPSHGLGVTALIRMLTNLLNVEIREPLPVDVRLQQRVFNALATLPSVDALSLTGIAAVGELHLLAGKLRRLELLKSDGLCAAPSITSLSRLQLLEQLTLTGVHDATALGSLLRALPRSLRLLSLTTSRLLSTPDSAPCNVTFTLNDRAAVAIEAAAAPGALRGTLSWAALAKLQSLGASFLQRLHRVSLPALRVDGPGAALDGPEQRLAQSLAARGAMLEVGFATEDGAWMRTGGGRGSVGNGGNDGGGDGSGGDGGGGGSGGDSGGDGGGDGGGGGCSATPPELVCGVLALARCRRLRLRLESGALGPWLSPEYCLSLSPDPRLAERGSGASPPAGSGCSGGGVSADGGKSGGGRCAPGGLPQARHLAPAPSAPRPHSVSLAALAVGELAARAAAGVGRSPVVLLRGPLLARLAAQPRREVALWMAGLVGRARGLTWGYRRPWRLLYIVLPAAGAVLADLGTDVRAARVVAAAVAAAPGAAPGGAAATAAATTSGSSAGGNSATGAVHEATDRETVAAATAAAAAAAHSSAAAAPTPSSVAATAAPAVPELAAMQLPGSGTEAGLLLSCTSALVVLLNQAAQWVLDGNGPGREWSRAERMRWLVEGWAEVRQLPEEEELLG